MRSMENEPRRMRRRDVEIHRMHLLGDEIKLRYKRLTIMANFISDSCYNYLSSK